MLIDLRRDLLIGVKLKELEKFSLIILSQLIKACFPGKSIREQPVVFQDILHGLKILEDQRICTACLSQKIK